MRKKKIGVYSATGCRACETAILDIHYQVGSLTRRADITFWPYVMGSQLRDLEAQDELDVCFFAGAIRTDRDRAVALELRAKSKVLLACGACAGFGGLPGLLNLPRPAGMAESAGESGGHSDKSPERSQGPDLPRLENRVFALSQVAEVDYVVPGCPPVQSFLWAAIQSLVSETESLARLSFSALRLPEPLAQSITSGVLPPKGSLFAGQRAVCESCSRIKEKKQFKKYNRPWQVESDPGRCLLEQGILCLGMITLEGCGGACTAAGLPCRGCFGKTAAVLDPGAKMVSAVGSTFDSDDPGEIAGMVDGFVDLAGTFYRYTLASQCLLLSSPERESQVE